MKKLLTFLFLILSFNFCKAQNPTQDPLIPYIHSGNAGVDSAVIEVYMPGRKGTNNKHFYKMPIDSLPSILIRLGMSGGTVVRSVTDNGSGVVVNNTDPLNPIVEADTTGILATKHYVDSHDEVGVDSVWRKAGVDSIYWKKNGVTYALKDSTAAFSPDSVTAHAWSLTGNTGTNSGVNFIGTTDDASLEFRVNDTTAMFIDSSNRHIGIGTVTPDADAMLHVEGLTPLYLHGSIPSVIDGSFSFGLKTTTAVNGYDYRNGYIINTYLSDVTGINALENHGVGNAGAFVQGAWINSTGSPRSYKKYYPTGDASYGIDTSYKVNYVYDNSNLYFPDSNSSSNFLDNSSSNFLDNSSSNFYDTSSANFYNTSSANFYDNSSLVLDDSSTFQFATGSEGEHKVLTSDAFGFATWQPLNRDTVFVPTTSSTDTLQDGYTGAILDAGATGITGYTLTMPPNPYEGQRILVSLADGTTFGMGYFAVDGNGSTVKANYVLVENGQYTFRYKNGIWY